MAASAILTHSRLISTPVISKKSMTMIPAGSVGRGHTIIIWPNFRHPNVKESSCRPLTSRASQSPHMILWNCPSILRDTSVGVAIHWNPCLLLDVATSLLFPVSQRVLRSPILPTLRVFQQHFQGRRGRGNFTALTSYSFPWLRVSLMPPHVLFRGFSPGELGRFERPSYFSSLAS